MEWQVTIEINDTKVWKGCSGQQKSICPPEQLLVQSSIWLGEGPYL
jgi:hypothetical protein